MNALTIITTALQSIPANVRKGLLLAYALVVVVVEILKLTELDWDYDVINQILLIVGGYLGVQSAANVAAPGEGQRIPMDPTPADPTIPEQRESPDG